jgi:branched-chain amino acid transport system permease protein
MLIYGLVNSIVLAIVAMGLNITFGISGIANISYGGFYVLAGYLAWIFLNQLHLPVIVSFLLSIICIGALGALMYRIVIERVRGIELSEVIATFGIGLIILELLRFKGFVGFHYNLPALVEGSYEIFGTYVDGQRLVIIVVGILLFWCFHLFTHHTKMGLAFRGIAQDEYTALTLGINSNRIAMLSVAVGSAFGAIAAILIFPLGTISIDCGYDVLINALAVGIVGGLGTTGGILAASLLIGYSQTIVSTYYAPHYSMIVSLAAILIVLVIKPSGLFGKQKELEERV